MSQGPRYKSVLSLPLRGCGCLHFIIGFLGPAIFLTVSFAVSVIGIIPLVDGKKRITIFVFLGIGFFVAVLGWRVAAKQEEKSEQQENHLAATQDSLRTVRKQLDEMLLQMNSFTSSIPPVEIALLAPDAPNWFKVAYGELNQEEIPGALENQRITEYFKSVGAKQNYRDDIDDWASAFAEWSLDKVGIPGPKSDDPFGWLEWGEGLKQPLLGCIVVMSFNGLRHVGFYFGEDEGFVRVLGGNQDDAVRIFRYPKSAIYGYRWPPELKVPESH